MPPYWEWNFSITLKDHVECLLAYHPEIDIQCFKQTKIIIIIWCHSPWILLSSNHCTCLANLTLYSTRKKQQKAMGEYRHWATRGLSCIGSRQHLTSWRLAKGSLGEDGKSREKPFCESLLRELSRGWTMLAPRELCWSLALASTLPSSLSQILLKYYESTVCCMYFRSGT